MNFERINNFLLLSFESEIFLDLKWKLDFIQCPLFFVVDYCQNILFLFSTHIILK